MKILITIPTWNEALIIERNLNVLQDAVNTYLSSHDVMIEVADNGSTDGTMGIIKNFQFSIFNFQIIEMQEKGKGLAIRRSWERHLADADVLIFMDADLAAGLAALPAIVEPILAGMADMVCGSRFAPGANVKRALHRTIASWMYRLLQCVILHLPVQDAQCGFKAISRAAASRFLPLCHETHWMFDTELIATVTRGGGRILEIPVSWIEHRAPERRSAIHVFKDGWGFVGGLFRIRLRTL